MNLFVQLTEEQYEQFKTFRQRPKLEDYTSGELAAALLAVIQKEGGQVTSESSSYAGNPNVRKKTTAAKLINNNFVISLIVEKY